DASKVISDLAAIRSQLLTRSPRRRGRATSPARPGRVPARLPQRFRNLRHRMRVRFLVHELIGGNLLRSPRAMTAQGLITQPLTHALQRERNLRGFAWLLVVLLVASYAVGLLRPAVAGEADDFRAVASAAPSNVPDTDAICNALAAAAQENDLPVDFFTQLIWQESRFDPTAVSRAGAQGVAQFMPATATWRGPSNPFDPLQAISHAAKPLPDLRREFRNRRLAAAAYTPGAG